MAASAGWTRVVVPTSSFSLVAFVPALDKPVRTLRIYIEGDGQAWRRRKAPSDDPTPADPLALRLALRDQQPAVYLARPCQYAQGANRRGCDTRYWTRARFSEEVIAASSQAVSSLKLRTGADNLILIGYSGGAAVAALVAARRNDVDKLVTVAGNLDHRAWTAWHRVSPLNESLNPADAWQALQPVPQLHLVGAEDRIIPPAIVDSYRRHFPATAKPAMRIIDGFDHHCCWAGQWPALMQEN
jgi:pimeloyl-ACP methyl ester carboxylesterase